MAYIYKITNQINNKVYIGKTEFSIEKRFKEHCADAFRSRNEQRPLYAAMRKYGIENFNIEEIEKTDMPEEREKYWIEYYQSFKNGYNATLGGDGKKYLDYDLVIATYKACNENCLHTAKKLSIDKGTVSRIVKEKGYNTHIGGINAKCIDMYDLDNQYIRSFTSSREAARFLIQEQNLPISNEGGYSSHIIEVCKGKRKTCQHYIWRYSSNQP